MTRPRDHTEGSLTEEQVIEILVEAKAKCEQKFEIRSSLFLGCRIPEDDPIAFMETAKLILKYRSKGAIGFASFGKDIEASDFKFFDSAFWFMKKHGIPVVLSAARSSPKNIVPASVEGRTARISGGYTLHNKPHIVRFLADRQIPVDLAVTKTMEAESKHLESFAGNVIRFLIDNDVRVIVCSMGRTLEESVTLSDVLEKVTNDCSIKIFEFVELLGQSFRSCSLPYAEREEMYRSFMKQAAVILDKAGFRQYFRRAVFTDTSIPHPQPHPGLPEVLQIFAKEDEVTAPKEVMSAEQPRKVQVAEGEEISVEGGSSFMKRVEGETPAQ